MAKFTRFFVVIGLIAAAIVAWRVLFPNPERQVHNRLVALAKAASFSGGDGNFAKLAYGNRVADFFAPDIEVDLGAAAGQTLRASGRDDLLEKLMVGRAALDWLKVEFLDISVTVAPDRQSAIADLAGKATSSKEKDFFVQEMKFTLKKIGGRWLIVRVELVKTLSSASAAPF